MSKSLENHRLISWPVLGSRPAYGDETDWFVTRTYGCSCGTKYGNRGYRASDVASLNLWFTMHCLATLGADFQVTELSLEDAVKSGIREAPNEWESRWMV